MEKLKLSKIRYIYPDISKILHPQCFHKCPSLDQGMESFIPGEETDFETDPKEA